MELSIQQLQRGKQASPSQQAAAGIAGSKQSKYDKTPSRLPTPSISATPEGGPQSVGKSHKVLRASASRANAFTKSQGASALTSSVRATRSSAAVAATASGKTPSNFMNENSAKLEISKNSKKIVKQAAKSKGKAPKQKISKFNDKENAGTGGSAKELPAKPDQDAQTRKENEQQSNSNINVLQNVTNQYVSLYENNLLNQIKKISIDKNITLVKS